MSFDVTNIPFQFFLYQHIDYLQGWSEEMTTACHVVVAIISRVCPRLISLKGEGVMSLSLSLVIPLFIIYSLDNTDWGHTRRQVSVWRRMTLPFLGIQVRNESWIYGLPKSSFILVFREQKLNEDSSDQQRAFRVLSLEESLASMHQSPPLRLDFPKSLIGICRLCNDRKNAQMTDKTNTKNIPTRITLRDDQHPGWGTFLQSLLRQPLIMLRFLYQSLFLEMKVLRSSKWM